MARNETFGRLLKAGISSIANCEGKTSQVIDEELGEQMNLAGTSIQRYKTGHIPPEMQTIEILAAACVQRGYLNRTWLQQFLHAARYYAIDKLVDRLCPTVQNRPQLQHVYENLPAPSYSQFVMRPDVYSEVVDGLGQRSALVVIASLGGMGKTSLAREIAARCLQEDSDAPRFDAVVWMSDKDRPGTTTLSNLLDEVSRTLNWPDFTQLDHAEKQRAVEQLLRQQRVLLVVDNFETVTDGALLAWLLRLPEPSKALITTREFRRDFRRGGWTVELQGMREDEAQQLMQLRLRRLKLAHLLNDPTQLTPLITVTGGNPKALEMALGLIKETRCALSQVIDDLFATRGDLFDDLFARSWEAIDEPTRRVWLATALFPESASEEALTITADVGGFIGHRALERLTDLALLDVQQTDLNTPPRYGVHPLVRAFATVRLHEAPEFEQQARRRWRTYFIDLAAQHLRRHTNHHIYWDTLTYNRHSLQQVEVEIPNFLNILAWADQQQDDSTLLTLMQMLIHWLAHLALFHERIYYARRAAAAARKLGQSVDEALFWIDALGWILIESNRLAEAEEAIKTGLAIVEALDDAQRDTDVQDVITLGYAFLTRIALDQDNIDQARRWLGKTLADTKMYHIHIQVCTSAGDLAYKQHDYQSAISWYRKALDTEKDPGSLQGYTDGLNLRLGFAYIGYGNLDQAETTFATVIQQKYKSLIEPALANYGLASIARVRGDYESARRIGQEALNILFRLPITHRQHQEIVDFLTELDD